MALGIALSGGAIGLPGKKVVDKNDLRKNVVKSKHVKNRKLRIADLSNNAVADLTEPRAYALVTGPNQVRERYSRGIRDSNVGVNNGAFCIRGIGFEPTHIQVTGESNTGGVAPSGFLDETTACSGETAVHFDGNLTYPQSFFVALFD
jgi:hypothetical protein